MKKTILTTAVASLMLTAFSATAAVKSVATIEKLQGSAVVERAGQRMVAKPGMVLQEGDKVITLEKADAQLRYVKSKCRMLHRQNTIVSLSEATQCARGTVYGVGAPAAAGGAGGSIAAVGVPTIVAGVATAVVVGAVVNDVVNDDDDDPVSK